MQFDNNKIIYIRFYAFEFLWISGDFLGGGREFFIKTTATQFVLTLDKCCAIPTIPRYLSSMGRTNYRRTPQDTTEQPPDNSKNHPEPQM